MQHGRTTVSGRDGCVPRRVGLTSGRYFQAVSLPGWGIFQDGGIRANNPVKIARRESALLWPSAERPELILSIGTGYESRGAIVPPEPTRGIWYNGFIPRLLRSQLLFSPALDGEQAWQDALDGFPPDLRHDSFRLNCEFRQQLPALDDVTHIDALSAIAYPIPDGLIHALFATSFFFELDSMPVLCAGRVHCRGSILCAAADPKDVIRRIHATFGEPHFAWLGGATIGPVDGSLGCAICGFYRCTVAWTVANLHETVTMTIRGRYAERHIAGFPNAMQWFVDQQGLAQTFGRADHATERHAARCFCPDSAKRPADTEPHARKRPRRR